MSGNDSPEKNESDADATRQEILELHEGGKIRMAPRRRLRSIEDLRKLYTPGVAHVSDLIENNPDQYYNYTSAGNTIAVLTNGTAVLGLGDVGVKAAMPVMEGKGLILMEMVDVSTVPVLVDSHDAEEIVATARNIAPTFGGILLEDIAAPTCFEVEDRLKETTDIPVFHDDQHGTAVVVVAALASALEMTGREAGDLRAVISGAGAGGCAVARFLLNYGVSDVVLCDSTGAIHEGRQEGMNPSKHAIAQMTNRENEKGSLADVMRGKDLFIGLSVEGLVSKDMVRSMAPEPIVFPMANPVPEIWPAEALEAGAAAAEDGRNINNALGFPGLFRGALDSRASEINEDMKVAASHALADAAPEGELVPDFMDKNVHRSVAEAVARAARASGVAGR